MVAGGILRLRCGGKRMIDWLCKNEFEQRDSYIMMERKIA